MRLEQVHALVATDEGIPVGLLTRADLNIRLTAVGDDDSLLVCDLCDQLVLTATHRCLTGVVAARMAVERLCGHRRPRALASHRPAPAVRDPHAAGDQWRSFRTCRRLDRRPGSTRERLTGAGS